MTERRFPPPWTVEKISGGLKVCDANGQSLAYVYSRENPDDAHIAKVLTEDEARCSAAPFRLERTKMLARKKAIVIVYIGIAGLLAAANSPSAAQDKGLGSTVDSYGYVFQSVVAIDGKVDCFSQLSETGATSLCDGFTPPPKVAIGESFTTDGKTRKIGVIRAYQADRDMLPDIKKGEWICVAAETLEDIPMDKGRNRTWLSIRKCQPDLAGNAPLPPPG